MEGAKQLLVGALLCVALSDPLLAFGSRENERKREDSYGEVEPHAEVHQSFDAPYRTERSAERNALVDTSIAGQGITDRAVLKAMRTVPRHRFVPDNLARSAYLDTALPIGYGQTISQPYVVAFMTEALELRPGEKVLEIGTGSGYQAAVLAEIVSDVYSIEIVEELHQAVRERLRSLGYESIRLRKGDGYYGWEAEAPFDKMIVTAAVDHVPLPLLKQLAPTGKMILPLGPPGGIQTLLLITKHADGSFERSSLLAVRFVPMTGRAQP